MNGEDYKVALGYYLSLKDLGYTGIESEYFITAVDTDTEEKVSETEYNHLKIF